jgi:hypothetical protein
MSVRVVVRCRAITQNGRQCQRRTGKTDLCYQHLEKEYHVKVRPSQIPNAGMGLYTTIARRPGQNIAPYSGQVIVNPRDDEGSPYALQVKKHPPTLIDAERTNTGAGRYSNNCRRGQCTNNSGLSYNARRQEANVKARRNILPGKEIYTAYGHGYWRDHEE